MKILFVSDSTTVSGAEIVMLGCIDGLRSRGHEPYGYLRDTNPRLIEAFRSRSLPFTATGAYSPRLIQTTANPVTLAVFARSFRTATRQMTRIIATTGVDVIHSISYPAALYAAFAAARTRTPHIWHEHNIKRIHTFNRVIYRQVASTCRWVIGPSHAVTHNLTRAGIAGDRLRTVYNGIDLARFNAGGSEAVMTFRRELGLAPDEKAIGLFGQMLPYKGHKTLVNAAPAILRQHARTRFFFVGALENPAYEKELKGLLAAKQLTDRFHFTGWRDDVQRIIQAMDVVVVATTTPEPAALMLMEAMAMERPIVASRTGGTAEIVSDRETGLLFAPGSSEELAERIVELLRDSHLAQAVGTAGRRRVERRFTYDRHLETMLELYGQATAGRIIAASSAA
jgi:glycosyltransferase involved in cell wall biosynthesis